MRLSWIFVLALILDLNEFALPDLFL